MKSPRKGPSLMKTLQGLTLITGSSGFIGSNLLKFEKEKSLSDFLIWNKQTMGSLLEKANREEQLSLLKPDRVIHLAWTSTKQGHYENSPENHEWEKATINFARECVVRNIKFITIGSAVEETPFKKVGTTLYAHAKNRIRTELSLESLVNYISYLKPGYIFSLEYQRPRLLGDFMGDRENVVKIIKNPSNYEKFIHVDDVVSGLVVILENDLRGVIELGGGIHSSVSDFINMTSLNLGIQIPFPWTAEGFTSVQPNPLLQSLGWESKATTKYFSTKAIGQK